MGNSECFEVGFGLDFRYPVIFCEGAFDLGNRTLLRVLSGTEGRPARCLVAVDAGLALAQPLLETSIHRWFADSRGRGVQLAASPLLVPGGEAAKRDLAVVEALARAALEHGVCRHSYVIGVGGGAALDAIGLAAALIHRGVRLVRLPTTVLSQCDAGIGVKNGVNAFGSKNFLGTFAPPVAVINDRRFLTTLDARSWRDGVAEAFKVAIIRDADFLAWLIAHAEGLSERDLGTMHVLVQRCARLHLEHIARGGDPFESGSSRPLDFGHWSAHQLEVLSRHRLSHGEAVAIGLAIDLLYAVRRGYFPEAACSLVLDALQQCGFRLYDEVLDLRRPDGRRQVLDGLERFREHLGGALTVAMPDGVGQRQDLDAMDEGLVEDVLDALRQRQRNLLMVLREPVN